MTKYDKTENWGIIFWRYVKIETRYKIPGHESKDILEVFQMCFASKLLLPPANREINLKNLIS